MPQPVWFWQRIVSPHMAGLAAALAASGVEVTYVAEQTMSPERAAQGWQAPDLGRARLLFAADRQAIAGHVASAHSDSIHVCQGVRGNGLVGFAQEELGRRGLRQWVIMEMIDDDGWKGILKRAEYRRLIRAARKQTEGILAIGSRTPDWLIRLGMPAERVFPFAYFLPNPDGLTFDETRSGQPFQIVYIGRLVALKQVDTLIRALAGLAGDAFHLTIVGSGPQEAELKGLAGRLLAGRISWLGQVSQAEVPAILSRMDCLVLPSRYDGWGAVVSEALMAGTPAVCSDGCGAATAVLASGRGGVFRAGYAGALSERLRDVMAEGRNSKERRCALAEWAQCLNVHAGAEYLERILTGVADDYAKPTPPWREVRGKAL